MPEFDFGDHRVISPATLEEMLLAIGEKENPEASVTILLSTELVADLCVRLVRLEDTMYDEGDIDDD